LSFSHTFNSTIRSLLPIPLENGGNGETPLPVVRYARTFALT
jgi:hypothetical protein